MIALPTPDPKTLSRRAEIAFALEFDEVASFHRAFRRWEKTTPAAFRARVRG